MKNELATVALALAVVLPLFGCNKSNAAGNESAAAAPSIPEMQMTAVDQMLKDKSGVVVDANGASTRQEYGVIPGAVLLSDHKSYALTELPSEKSTKLVFYCGGTACRASDAAAGRAASAGYSNVSVLREGIRGWKGAGRPTTMPQS
jgi:rhodanese-related sulfurtransferase